MWKCIFDSATNIGKAFNREPLDGEYARDIAPPLCGDFNVNPSRYSWDGSALVEREGWEDEMVRGELAAWRESTKCGPLQFRRALRAMNLMDTVTTYMETADPLVVEAWEYTTLFMRNDELVLAVQAELQASDEDVDTLFQLALTFP